MATTTSLDNRLSTYTPTALGVFRIVFGVLFLCHAGAHLIGWPGGQAAAIGQWPYFYAGVIELVTGLLITIGLFTRIAAFIASGTMAVAFFLQHVPSGGIIPMNNGGEAAVLYCFAFLFLAFAGAGDLALDNRRR
jgi:putative oxidoreductase